jgi:hypothetical protein
VFEALTFWASLELAGRPSGGADVVSHIRVLELLQWQRLHGTSVPAAEQLLVLGASINKATNFEFTVETVIAHREIDIAVRFRRGADLLLAPLQKPGPSNRQGMDCQCFTCLKS